MRCQKHKKRFRILTLIFSAGGVFGWKIWEPVAVIACIIIAIIQLLTLIQNEIIKSDNEIIEIGNLRSRYIKYFNQLEKLWTEFEQGKIEDQKASERFFKLRTQLKEKIESLDNTLNIKQIEKLLRKTDKQEKQYFFNRYGQAK